MKHNVLISKIILTVTSAFIFLSGTLAHAAIPASERAALIALYNATDGGNWTNNSGWKDGTLEADGFGPIGSEDTWYGIIAPRDYVSHIRLYGNNLKGNLPPELGNLTQLEVLNLSSNLLTGSIPISIGNIGTLIDLDLGVNNLSGFLPYQIGNLVNLEKFNLYQNQLSGPLPDSLGNLSNLERLNLNDNKFSGSIPPELGQLKKLFDLDLSHNHFSGDIPPGLSGMGADDLGWKSINLEHNHLSGTIPGSFGGMKNVWIINLKGNRLNGPVPVELTSMLPLHSVNLGFNKLYTDNQGVRDYLEIHDPTWQWQTVPPKGLAVTVLSATSLKLQWEAINYIWESGAYIVHHGPTENGPWTLAGMTPDKRTNYLEITELTPGQRYYFMVQTQTDANNSNPNTLVSDFSPRIWAYTLNYDTEINPPFGSFDTPLDNSTVSGSIAVTGWALDDSAVEYVKIYRESTSGLIYVGDADLVDGARPDVAAAYPDYPNKNQAGWGYMLLTNFLPNSGNGTVVLHAIATDITGKNTDLGGKTIICDNANAIKPFGAIDTPAQGGLASGNVYINWGWALTPQPNTIPIDGSTIDVWIDGVNIGHPVYNIFRQDISNLFPGYNNSEGAVGYFYMDTAAYADGVHTIQWTVKDDAGNVDGIGSRYFTIQNTSNRSSANTSSLTTTLHPSLSSGVYSPIAVRKGYDRTSQPLILHPDQGGLLRISIKPMERLEIDFMSPKVEAVQIPVGSTVTDENLFMWQPGPAHLGVHRLIFNTGGENGKNGQLFQQEIIVIIAPPLNKKVKRPQAE